MLSGLDSHAAYYVICTVRIDCDFYRADINNVTKIPKSTYFGSACRTKHPTWVIYASENANGSCFGNTLNIRRTVQLETTKRFIHNIRKLLEY